MSAKQQPPKKSSRIGEIWKIEQGEGSSEEEYEAVVDFLRAKLDLSLETYRQTYVRRRVHAAMMDVPVYTYRSFLQHLRSPAFDPGAFIRKFTVNYTTFFRDVGPFRYFEATILPEIVAICRRAGRRAIRIWSAGCASGEEPYSIAIILDHFLRQNRLDDEFKANILATDIDPAPLAKAKKGRYIPQQLKNISPESLYHNFTHFPWGEYMASPRIRRYVSFQQHDLLSGKSLGHFDCIFCRNVFIYFDDVYRSSVLKLFWDSLREPGYLIVGGTDHLNASKNPYFGVHDVWRHVYKKK